MDQPALPIACNTGYLVQIASALSVSDLRVRTAALLSAHKVPARVAWTPLRGSCPIWNVSEGAVLYSGPYASADDACDARLHSPADAFIKIIDPARHNDFFSCLCKPTYSSLPVLSKVGEKSSWVGDLQRALHTHGYSIAGLDGTPGEPDTWGVYTDQTRTAVQRYQTDQSLPADGTVGATTWQALQLSYC